MDNYDVAGILTTYSYHARNAKKYREAQGCCKTAKGRTGFKENTHG